MRIHRLPVLAAALVALLYAPRPARSWDSICYRYADETANVGALSFLAGSRGCEGASAARGRWRDPEKKVDEHRQIFAQAVIHAGLPMALLETQKLSVFVIDQMVPSTAGSVPSVKPRQLPNSTGTYNDLKGATRAFALDELAQLPDFSYGLWDWASGNETCPIDDGLGTVDSERCHAFATHMGAVNANHFPPQSDAWYDHYHKIAMDRAAQCTANRAAARQRATDRGESASTMDQNLKETWKACEVEALAYEAIAQHYLQDSWSAGHMWQRWGSSDLRSITNTFTGLGSGWDSTTPALKRMIIAEIVAVVAGTVHGSDPLFFERFGVTLHDQLCYPHRDVQGVDTTGIINTAGDLHLHDVLATPDAPTHGDISSKPLAASLIFGGHFSAQGNRLIQCSAGSLGAVYNALKGSDFQPMLGDAPASPISFDAANCRAPMQTNDGMDEGVDDLGVGQLFLNIGAYNAALSSVPAGLALRATADYTRLQSESSLRSWFQSEGTHLSTNPGTMLGVGPNGSYSTTPPDNLVDPKTVGPDLPFAGSGSNLALGTAVDTKSFWLTQTFRRARAPDICTHQREFAYRVDIDKLLQSSRSLPDPATLSGDAKKSVEAACQACAEYIGPYLWNTASWNGSRLTGAPLCSYAPDYPRPAMLRPESNDWGLEPETTLTMPDGGDTRWFAHWQTQNSRGGIDAIPIGYDSPLHYVGGSASATPEEMAKLTCCARLDTGGGTGNFRLQGKITGQPIDSVVTFLLTPASSSSIEADDMDPTYYQPIIAHLPTTDPTKGSRIVWTDEGERFGVRYDIPVDAKALYDTGKAITESGDAGLRWHFGNPAKNFLPAAGSFRLTPLMAMDEKRGWHCTFDPPSRVYNLSQTNAEIWDADFAMSCSDDVSFKIGYPRAFPGWATVTREPVEVDGTEYQWVLAQRVFVNGPVTLENMGLQTPHAGGGNVRMALYKEDTFAFPVWASTATLVAQTGPAGLGDGENLLPASGELAKGAYWIVATIRGDDSDTTTLGYSPWVLGMAWGANFLIPVDGAFEPTISLSGSQIRFFHLNFFLKVK